MQSHNPEENEAKPRKQPQNIRFCGLKIKKTSLATNPALLQN